MTFHDFRELNSLSLPALRALLNAGDGRERVWAAWQLGLRAGQGSVPTLTTNGQPDPGVRSHLAVILAGLGETETLRTMAVDDPDPDVRATVCDYLCRVTSGDQIPSTSALLQERTRLDPSPIPVARIFEAWPNSWPLVEREHWIRALNHPEARVRRACLEYLRRVKDRVANVGQPMTESLSREPDPDLLLAKAGFIGAAASADVLIRRATENSTLAPRLLTFLATNELTVGWDEVRPHLWSEDPVVVAQALELTDHQANVNRSDYITRLGELLQWGRYQRPEDAFALSDQDQERRHSHYAAIKCAQGRFWHILDADFPLPRELGPALRFILQGIEDDLRYFLTEDLDYLEAEGVDVDAEIADLNSRRRRVLNAIDRLDAL